jgi:hypothetical protein
MSILLLHLEKTQRRLAYEMNETIKGMRHDEEVVPGSIGKVKNTKNVKNE